MIATTISQSRNLLKLGLDPRTADMGWYEDEEGEQMYLQCINYQCECPAWSLSALLEVMPKEHMPTLSRYGNNWFMGSLARDSAAYNTPIEAAYSQVCWLLEQGLIKKGGDDA